MHLSADFQNNQWEQGEYREGGGKGLELTLKVHKIENFFGSEFEFCTISLLVLLKYLDFDKKNFFDWAMNWGRYNCSA